MAIRDDVVVIGGGLAGTTAALAAAREGASVRLLSMQTSTLRHASGLIDVLGYASDGGAGGDRDGPLVDPFAAIPSLPADHPYRLVGVDAVREGLALFDEAVDGRLRYFGGHTDRNALVPTHGGTVKPTARYPASTAAGLAAAPGDVLLVGFRSLTDFDAPLVAERLSATGLPAAVAGVTVDFPKSFRDDATVTRYASALDADEPVDRAGSGAPTGVRAALAATVEPHVERTGADRVGFPALLGGDRPGAVRTDLADRLGAEVFEVPMGPPSLPGLRLEAALTAALDDAGVRRTTGDPVVESEADGGRVETVAVDATGRRVPYAAAAFVLATGGFAGKGLVADRRTVAEPVFGCRVPAPEDRTDWYDDDPFGDHAFARMGVRPDDRLRPLDADGAPEFENLYAAGGVVGGADVAAENSASGVSLATGLVAGRNAASHAPDTP